MSVLIRGMKKPKCCRDCPIFVSHPVYSCRLLNDYYEYEDICVGVFKPWKQIMKFCPLVEVPTPHGRLIDENNLFEQHDGKVTHHHADGFDWFIKNAKVWLERNAPTVIEAEE